MAPNNVKELTELGDKCCEKGNFAESILHYTHAIKIDGGNYDLYEKRCYAFFKLQHYYFAYEDSKEMIKLKPNKISGYLKKGLIEFETGNYSTALKTYQENAVARKSNDSSVSDAIERSKIHLQKQMENDAKIPWIGAAFGLILGICIVVGDYIFFLGHGYFKNPMIQAAIICATAYMTFSIFKLHVKSLVNSRKSQLLPPTALDLDFDS